jgi:prolyl 4-hydroxylase
MAKVKLKSPEERMVDMGRSVMRRLGSNPKVQANDGNGLTLYTVQDFLSRDECAALIEVIDANREKSALLADHPDPDYRTSDSCNLEPEDPFVRGIEARICDLMGINPKHGETLQGQVYEVGQQFKRHYDYFFPNKPYWPRMQQCGGQRCWTGMVYLNEPASGGETDFPTAGLKVIPRTAMLVLWNNMTAEGAPNVSTLHAGLPVQAGTKYVVTKWFRERFWVRPTHQN